MGACLRFGLATAGDQPCLQTERALIAISERSLRAIPPWRHGVTSSPIPELGAAPRGSEMAFSALDELDRRVPRPTDDSNLSRFARGEKHVTFSVSLALGVSNEAKQPSRYHRVQQRLVVIEVEWVKRRRSAIPF